MNRGFITIATGKKRYYEIAANLLRSYHEFSDEPYPFAVIAEEENEFTKLFDITILTAKATHSFMDKFLLLELCPFDETIFIDADCLAYGDLNRYFDLFDGATDFSAPGVNVPVDSATGAWYNIEGIGEYGSRIDYKVRVHSGICFIRKSESLPKLYDDCKELIGNFDKLYFHTCPNSKDECVLGVAMPMNQMKAVKQDPQFLATYPCCTYLKADILHGSLEYKAEWTDVVPDCILMHWGTAQTDLPLYRFEVACLNRRMSGCNNRSAAQKLLYDKRLLYYLYYIPYFFKVIHNKAIRAFHRLTK